MMCLRYSNSIFLKSSGNREDYIDIQVLKTNSLCSPRVLRCSQGMLLIRLQSYYISSSHYSLIYTVY